MMQPLPYKIYHSCFMWHDRTNALFVNYQPKHKKSVCLFSTMHSSSDVDTDFHKQSQILYYSIAKLKVGVECFDQMTHLYATRSASKRWPLSVWGNILDIIIIIIILLQECASFSFYFWSPVEVPRMQGSAGFCSLVAIFHDLEHPTFANL